MSERHRYIPCKNRKPKKILPEIKRPKEILSGIKKDIKKKILSEIEV